MHILAMILLIVGIGLVVVATIVFFATDCKTIFRSLVTTRPIPVNGGINRNSIKNIYYTNQAFNIFNRFHHQDKERSPEEDILNRSSVSDNEDEHRAKSETETLSEIINVDSAILKGDERSYEKKDF